MEFSFGHVYAEWPGEDKLQNELEQLILQTVNETVIIRPAENSQEIGRFSAGNIEEPLSESTNY